jgi:hypothetical protein
MSFTLKTLTEGIRDRHVGQQNQRLVEKWSRTGLLRGMEETNRENMATLLENQAAQLLRESNTMGSDNVGGFTNIAFPIVRRVFGGLVANELVSIQPMSLPSGLLFYLDYTYGTAHGHFEAGDSIYGSPKGKLVQEGADAVGGQYDLAGSGYSRRHSTAADLAADDDLISIGAFSASNATHLKLVQHDPQLLDLNAGSSSFHLALIKTSALSSLDVTAVKDVAVLSVEDRVPAALTAKLAETVQSGLAHNVRRLNQLGTWDGTTFTPNGVSGDHVLVVLNLASGKTIDGNLDVAGAAADNIPEDVSVSFVIADSVSVSSGGEADGTPAFESDMVAGTPSPEIPEIDIKIESIPVTAQTRKLRARWSPELAQDLNAYHSMDAEVELTQILSEQIALEIDREILGDLLSGAQGANFFWSRSPGKFVNKRTGAEIARTSTLNPGPAFTGTVREWYETLTETVIDVANEIHRKTLRGSANFIVVSPDVATILEASVLYRPSYSLDGDGQVGAPFTMGAEKIGTLSNRFTVYKDPYFPRNKILVGYKGGSYLETGFVYAPYVPLIVTPTIFQPEDFTPRKGVMTRYGKKMVRADFYGTVTCLDMNVI